MLSSTSDALSVKKLHHDVLDTRRRCPNRYEFNNALGTDVLEAIGRVERHGGVLKGMARKVIAQTQASICYR